MSPNSSIGSNVRSPSSLRYIRSPFAIVNEEEERASRACASMHLPLMAWSEQVFLSVCGHVAQHTAVAWMHVSVA
jgi:hypothetical protein